MKDDSGKNEDSEEDKKCRAIYIGKGDLLFMGKYVNLLDCTLRDGGYVNDWLFGHSVITSVYKRLDIAGVDYIEVGFLDDRRKYDGNRTIQPSTEAFDKVFDGVDKKHATPLAMIDYGTCDLSAIAECDKSFIDGIRVIFKKEKIAEALPFCRKIKEKGYKLFIQAISITAYSDREMIDYIDQINNIRPYAFSIVDTYGLLDRRKLTNYFNLMDNNLSPDIFIGYHAHNNFQLGFSNSVKFTNLETSRNLIVDGTVYGMGKSAGNCPIELISTHLNEHHGRCYDIDQFLEIFDTDLMSIYQKHYWGYRYDYYMSAMQKCHPSYVQYLMDKKKLSVSAVNSILGKIPKEKKLLYDEGYIKHEYFAFQSKKIDDQSDVDQLKLKFGRHTVLCLGPGKSIISEKTIVDEFIKDFSPLVIAVNADLNIYDCDFVFLSNSKRYGRLCDAGRGSDAELILTSNISAYDLQPDYVLNFESLQRFVESDDAMLLCLSALIRLGVMTVNLAGFDGFSSDVDDYFDQTLEFGRKSSLKKKDNDKLKRGIDMLGNSISINFLTNSLYRT